MHQEAWRKFNESIDASLGPGSTDADFDAEDLTPEFPHMEDQGTDNLDDQTPDEVTPEAGDAYVNAEISLPKGGSIAIEQQSIDEDKAFRVNLWLLLGTL